MDEATVITKCRYFRQIGLWPRQSELDFEGWLQNFLPTEKEFAIALLNSFCYFSNDLTQQLFQGCFHSISKRICGGETDFRSAQIAWRTFIETAIITRVTGENPNDSDSGFRYVRMARQQLGIREDQILQPDIALEARLDNPQRALIFVDDFIGSGQQFIHTWQREYWAKSLSDTSSFAKVCSSQPGADVVYCAPISTGHGIGKIAEVAPMVKIESAHILNAVDSVIDKDSSCWPEHLKSQAIGFIKKSQPKSWYSARKNVWLPWSRSRHRI